MRTNVTSGPGAFLGQLVGQQLARELEAMGAARDQLVRVKGPRCAAWLVFSHRRLLRRDGAIRLHLRPGERLPFWARVAVACLETRERSWAVDHLPGGDVVVAWRRHGQQRGRVGRAGPNRERNARKRLRSHLRLVR